MRRGVLTLSGQPLLFFQNEIEIKFFRLGPQCTLAFLRYGCTHNHEHSARSESE